MDIRCYIRTEIVRQQMRVLIVCPPLHSRYNATRHAAKVFRMAGASGGESHPVVMQPCHPCGLADCPVQGVDEDEKFVHDAKDAVQDGVQVLALLVQEALADDRLQVRLMRGYHGVQVLGGPQAWSNRHKRSIMVTS
eukprot:scaffold119054_cov24-Prasinocladus_malaysianus.AAC.1